MIRVLLVDDHRMFTEMLTQQLREHRDIEVTGVAHTVAEALSTARDDPPDVAVLDYRLPDGDGVTIHTASDLLRRRACCATKGRIVCTLTPLRSRWVISFTECN